MPNKRMVVAIAGVLVMAARAGAQAPACGGPGAAFGVTAYNCASCAIKQDPGTRTEFTFQAEPTVVSVAPGSVLRPGDVIEAIDGEPILTKGGSDRYTYPRAGSTMITVRRGGSRVPVVATAAACDAGPSQTRAATSPLLIVDGVALDSFAVNIEAKDIETVEVLKGAAAMVYGPRAEKGVVLIRTKRPTTIRPQRTAPPAATGEPLLVVDGVRVAPGAETMVVDPEGSGRRFGFAIGCLPSCTRTRATDGTGYYKFDGYPPVVAVTPGGPADKMGIRVNDLITEIDGKSILTEEGATRFFAVKPSATMSITVLRDRVQVSYLLRAR